MGYYCCVLGCLKTSDDGVHLHKFPFNNQLLLPIWIMATNRPDWLPSVKSRICDRHFSIDDYEAGDKNNMLRPDACPIFNVISNSTDGACTDSEDSELFSSTESVFTYVNTHELPSTPNTCDMKSSDDSTTNFSPSSSSSNSNEVTEFDDDFQSSISDSESKPGNIDLDESVLEFDSVSLSSSVTSCENTNQCAVVLCNAKARNQFDRLFYINFPLDNETLCETWWTLCGRREKFDPMIKICSIHFDPNDFTSVTIRRDGQLFRQTILNSNNIVPTLYLQPYEYTKFARKRKRSRNDSYSTAMSSTEVETCVIEGCDKTISKDEKRLFFRFPLENKTLLKNWVNSIGFPNWQPTHTDQICSNHFENDAILKIDNVYSLTNDAIPSIKLQNSFAIKADDLHDKKSRSLVNSRSVDFVFNNLKFSLIEDCTLLVDDTIVKKKEESLLYQQSKKHKRILKISTTQSSSTKKNDNNDTLDNINNIQRRQSKHKSTSSIDKRIKPYKGENTKGITEKEVQNENSNNINLEYVYMDTLNDKNVTEVESTNDTNNRVKEKNLIPKSRNNGNDRDYVYLDSLDGDDAELFLSFEKKSISRKSNKNILKLLEKSRTDEIPESIIYNQDLTECYGEMLPPFCDPNCQLKCYYSIPGPQRRQIFKQFYMLPNVTEQNSEITQLVQLRMIKRENTFESCPVYHLTMIKESVIVCRTFFLNTLGIPEQRLDAILKPINYSWYSDKDTALKANQPKQANIISEPVVMTDFMKESLKALKKDYNAYEPEDESEVSLENVPFKEYEKVFLYMKGIPRVLSTYQEPGTSKKYYFETSICLEYMYKRYSENFIKNNTPPPCTKRQFKKIYNQYMKTFLKMV